MSKMTNPKPPRHRPILASLDIGTTKICCLIMEYDPSSTLFSVLGVGQYASSGIKNGYITNIEALENAIVNAVYLAEKMADTTIEDVFVNISGSHMLSEIISYSLNLGDPRTVHDQDLETLLAKATHVHQSNDFDILHAFPLSYTLDGQDGVKDPLGLRGSKLASVLHVMTASKSPLQNLVTCVQKCHLNVHSVTSSAIASGYATLVEDERELGVTLIDIGGGTTEIAVFFEGNVIHTDSIPLGGRHITNDIAHGLSTPLHQAERLKTLYGSALLTREDEIVTIPVKQMGDDSPDTQTEIKRKTITSFIKPRTEEIFEITRSRLEKNDMYKIAGRRIVLTGGTSQLGGIRDIATQVLGKQVRLGKPLKIHGDNDLINSPTFSTSAGLIYFGYEELQAHKLKQPGSASWMHSMIEWMKENF